MFESWLYPSSRRRLAQPVLSFALHAGLLILVVTPGGKPSRELEDPIVPPIVIWHPDGPSPGPQVAGNAGEMVPLAPLCECTTVVPGPIPAGMPEQTGVMPMLGGAARDRLATVGTSHRWLDQEGVSREEISVPPVVIRFPDPVYPPGLKAAGVEGQVTVDYVVDAGGHVESYSISIVSSDHPLMADAVRHAVEKAQFEPGRVRGAPVRMLVRQTIRFSLMPL